MSSYARLAKLPPPKLGPVEINSILRRATGIETRMPVFFEECAPLTIQADADQLEQALINLIRNAVDAAQITGGRVLRSPHSYTGERVHYGTGRRARPFEYSQFVCAVLHYEARRVGHRAGV